MADNDHLRTSPTPQPSSTSPTSSTTSSVQPDANSKTTMTLPGGKSKKKARIPRPMNSFMCFGKHQRRLIQQEHPNLDNKAVSKILGQRWAALGPEDREKYKAEAQRLAEEHKLKYPDWRFTRETKKKEKKAKAKESRGRKTKQPPRTTSTVVDHAKPEPMEDDDGLPSYDDALDMTRVHPHDVEQLSQLNQLYSEQADPSLNYGTDYDSSLLYSSSPAYPSDGANGPPQITVSSHQSDRNPQQPSSQTDPGHPLRYVGSPLDALSVQHSPFSPNPPPYCAPPNFHEALSMLLEPGVSY